jgi:hypothetical protein
MSLNLYEEFMKMVVSPNLIWACYSTNNYHTYSAVNPEHLLVVTFRLLHPSTDRGRYRNVSWGARRFRETFDIATHFHFYNVTVDDPAFRWGRKRVLDIEAAPDDAFYGFLADLHKQIQKKAHMISKERPFDSRMSGLRDALEDIVNKRTGLPVM